MSCGQPDRWEWKWEDTGFLTSSLCFAYGMLCTSSNLLSLRLALRCAGCGSIYFLPPYLVCVPFIIPLVPAAVQTCALAFFVVSLLRTPRYPIPFFLFFLSICFLGGFFGFLHSTLNTTRFGRVGCGRIRECNWTSLQCCSRFRIPVLECLLIAHPFRPSPRRMQSSALLGLFPQSYMY